MPHRVVQALAVALGGARPATHTRPLRRGARAAPLGGHGRLRRLRLDRARAARGVGGARPRPRRVAGRARRTTRRRHASRRPPRRPLHRRRLRPPRPDRAGRGSRLLRAARGTRARAGARVAGRRAGGRRVRASSATSGRLPVARHGYDRVRSFFRMVVDVSDPGPAPDFAPRDRAPAARGRS